MPEDLTKIQLKLAELEGKIDAIFISVEKTRNYILWTGIITAAVIIIPGIILAFVLPAVIESLTKGLMLPPGF